MACHGHRLCHCAPPRHCTPASSLRGTKQSTAALAQAHGLPRRCAPRNDAVGPPLHPLPRHCTPASSLHPCLVIARNEAIHQRLHKNLDCHGAARRAMTDGPPLHPISPRRKLLAAEGRASHQQGEPPYICLRLHDSCHCHSGCSLGLNRRSHDQIHPLPRRPTSELAAILEQLLDCSAGAAASPQRPQHRGWAQCSRSNGP